MSVERPEGVGLFDNWLDGYTKMVWFAILTQSAGGLIVAMVLKYADNIIKCFGNAVAIVFSCFVTYYFEVFTVSFVFVFGVFLVVSAVILYSIDLGIANPLPNPWGKAIDTDSFPSNEANVGSDSTGNKLSSKVI
eukprot:Trichotokara_eunicae@DN5841_c0_g1_i2.p1